MKKYEGTEHGMMEDIVFWFSKNETMSQDKFAEILCKHMKIAEKRNSTKVIRI